MHDAVAVPHKLLPHPKILYETLHAIGARDPIGAVHMYLLPLG